MLNYRYCPSCGAPISSRTVGGRERAACERCDRVYYHNPVAAAAAVLLDGDRILLARRDSSQFRGRWYIPAGFVEADETVEAAAIREAKEETGLDVEIIELLAAHSGFEVPGRPVVGVYFLVRIVGGNMQPGSDVDRLEYYPLDAVPDLPFEGDRVVVELIRSRA